MTTESPGVPSPAPALPRRVPYDTLGGSIVILLVALFFHTGLPFINSRVPGTATIAADTRIPIGRGVSYTTSAGWSADLAKTKPNDTSALSRDDGSSFVLTTFDWTASQDELVLRTRSLFEGLSRLHLYSDQAPFRTANGLAGITYTIHGANLEGRVWVILLPGTQHAIAARVRGLPGHFDTALRDATTMVNRLSVEAKP